MKKRPILFSGPMVRAILDGSKTQTRRAFRPQPRSEVAAIRWCQNENLTWQLHYTEGTHEDVDCPYGQPRDRLWVREAWQYANWTEDGEPCVRYAADGTLSPWLNPPEDWADRLQNIWAELSEPENYNIDRTAADRRWRAARYMPRWASRITLEITDVRVQRLQDISLLDVYAEGCERPNGPMLGSDVTLLQGARNNFQHLWDSINAEKHPWASNPWVWCLAFKRVV